MRIGCYIKLGTMVHAITELITFGNAYTVALWIARKFGKNDCGCYEREVWLNNLTCNDRERQETI
jgi:hypothetical protein